MPSDRMDYLVVVDDEPYNLDLYRRALLSHTIKAYLDPTEALDEIVQSNPTALIVDYKMPKLDGLELVRRCRIAGYEGGVLMVTAFGDLDQLLYSEQTNLFYRIIPKPIIVAQFRDQVELVIAESRFQRQMEGRRRHPRFAVPLEVHVGLGEKQRTCKAKNLSMGGVLLEVDLGEPAGSVLPLELVQDAVVLTVKARVVRVGVAGTGLEFIELDPEARHGIGQLVTDFRYVRHDRRKNERRRTTGV